MGFVYEIIERLETIPLIWLGKEKSKPLVNTSEAEVLKIALFKILTDPSFWIFINSVKEIMVVIPAMINFIFLAGSGLQL